MPRSVLRSCQLNMTNSSSDRPAAPDYPKLLSLAVHEMRTPASVIAGYLRMILNDPSAPLDERHRRMLVEAEKGCTRLVDILAELSDLGKLDAGTAVLHDDRFDLFELARTVTASVHEPLDREVALEYRGLTTGAPVRGDKARVMAALTVVIRAVVREQPSNTIVVVDAQRAVQDGRPFARIVVAPEPDLARAASVPPSEFDDRRGGLGLGLPLARRVVGKHGGAIWSPMPEDGTLLPIGARGAIALALPLE